MNKVFIKKILVYPEFDDKIRRDLSAVFDFVRFNKDSDFYSALSFPAQLSLENFCLLPILGEQALREKKLLLRHYPEEKIRYLSSEFNPDNIEQLFLMPQRIDTIWQSLDDELKAKNPLVAMASLPIFWQLGPMFYQTCRKNKIPVSVIPPRNVPLLKQVIKEAEGQSIVTTPQTAEELFPLLKETSLLRPILFWHIVSPIKEKNTFLPLDDSLLFQEKHLMPGIPIAFQCQALASKRNEVFHPASSYFWEFEEGRARITSLTKEAFPLIRYELPAPVIQERQQCECGEILLLTFDSSPTQ